MSLKALTIEGDWTLFLDRDGVINQRIVDDYVKAWNEFVFLPGVLEAINLLSQKFRRMVVVSNQQGVGKGLMRIEDVDHIHRKMKQKIITAGGRLDGVYFCPELAVDEPRCRKPNPGMAWEAKKDFPEIDFRKSIMAGDSSSDMAFGKNLGMTTCFVHSESRNPGEMGNIDFIVPDLLSLANQL